VEILDLETMRDRGAVAHNYRFVIDATDGEVLGEVMTQIWNNMNQSLLDGRVNDALTAITTGSRDKFGPLFGLLQTHYPEIFASYSNWQLASVAPGQVEFAVNRNIDGDNRIFFVSFIQEPSGVWRIVTM
jgi:hypothetical protein